MIELTEDQCHAIAVTDESPPTVINPQTKAAYVLVRREIYDRLKHVLDDDDDARMMAPLLAELDPEDWEDASAYEAKL